jgi:CubicO group peptidase (beta-lactamase class C family)
LDELAFAATIMYAVDVGVSLFVPDASSYTRGIYEEDSLQHDDWPTSGWKTAPPEAEAMDSTILAQIGYLYLRRGRWEGQQLLPEEYVKDSSRTQVTPNGVVVVPDTYGYLWWVSTVGPYASFYAIGYGGQTIYVIPALDVVLVTTVRWDVPADLGAGPRVFLLAHDLAERFVLSAVALS